MSANSINNAILIVSPEPWDAYTVSKHHYAMTLADRGHQTFFLNPPDENCSDITIRSLSEQPNLFVVDSPKVASGLRFYPAFLRRWLESRWLMRLECRSGSRFTTIWLFENSRFFDMRFAGNCLKIYHQVDLNQEFNLKLAASTADICFCTTDIIRDRLLPHSDRVYKIHHGLALPREKIPLSASQQRLFESGNPHAGYIGNLEMQYLDVELLARVIHEFPRVQFHLVGGFQEDGLIRKLVCDAPNAVWWGKVDSVQIPAILERVDVLLVTYQTSHWQDQASPHKLLEYLASGKAVVSTYTDEYKDKRHLLEMVDDSRKFNEVFSRVIADLPLYNSPERQAMRNEYALQHSYDRQLDRIIALLDEHGLKHGFRMEA